MSELNQMSYNISCDHINQLRDNYNDINDRLFKNKFICFDINDNDNDNKNNINKNIGYLNNLYISRKSCIYTSTEPDEFKWANSYVNNDIYNNTNTTNTTNTTKFNENNAKFNENTRRKILTRY